MAGARKFRFGAQIAAGRSRDEWIEKARKCEDLGYSTLFMPDHFDDQLAPMPALAVAAAVTSALRVGGLVLDNDYKHAVVLAKELATLDVLSGGRVEAGIGAGWMVTDYEGSGISYDPPGTRIRRLKEGLRIMKGLWSDEPVAFDGEFYSVHMSGTPKPVQKPHPPVLIGGGGKRVLSFAAREADIISVNFALTEGRVGRGALETGSAEATREKIRWIREAAGARFDQIELGVTVFAGILTDDREGMAARVAPGFGATAEEALTVPHALIGSVDQCVEELQRRREEYGFSYVAFSGNSWEAMAPVVARLAGT
ncbi:MAG TPA: TIGR03621 family F420-dependent LLM class oxidoreductase [Dehalococcoidia bacterium]|nr:TIGR03621 family F420-dependent LLM class oxidoreductase [Dehalococcoidia bacterium]